MARSALLADEIMRVANAALASPARARAHMFSPKSHERALALDAFPAFVYSIPDASVVCVDCDNVSVVSPQSGPIGGLKDHPAVRATPLVALVEAARGVVHYTNVACVQTVTDIVAEARTAPFLAPEL
jgi:hypothetical protein